MPYSRPLTEPEIQQALETLLQWEARDDRLRKVFALHSFRAAIAFVNQVAELAEAADHHPNITIAYKNVTLVLTTWAAGGKLTARDIQLARQIEETNTQAPM
jgi:4a-hydroxytetrahydrobiopterin dehydratase